MPIERTFLTWDRPFLPQLADWLVASATVGDCGGVVDLDEWLVVLPVRSGSRRLTELLVDRTEGRMRPPALLTPADFPERLYRLKQPFATPHTQLVTWVKAIRSQSAADLRTLVPVPPKPDASREWFALAELLARQNRELARDDLDFRKVADRLDELEGYHERDRWRVLAKIEQTFLDTLDSFELWDRQAARLFAVQHDECRTNRRIVLAGTSDLNTIVQDMVRQAAANGAKVDAVVFADPANEQLFDDLGVLDAAAWQDFPVSIDDDAIAVADDAADEANVVGLELAALSDVKLDDAGRSRSVQTTDITVACPNDRLVAVIEGRLAEAGVACHWAAGRDLIAFPPCQVLRLLVRSLEQPSSEATVRLLRHPSLDGRVLAGLSQAEALEQVDRFRAERLPRTLQSAALRSADEHATSFEPPRPGFATAAAAVARVETLLAGLSGPDRPIGEWMAVVDATLEAVFLAATPFASANDDGDEDGDEDGNDNNSDDAVAPVAMDVPEADATDRAVIEAIRQTALQFRRMPDAIREPVSAVDAIGQLLDLLRGASVPPVVQPPEAVSLTGWLELPFDDRPVAIVTDVNDGIIPTAVTSDVFLPGSVRSALGLNDNARRYARDAYAMTAVLRSKQRCRLVVARRDSEGNPLPPSRMLFRESPERTAARMQTLLAPQPPRRRLRTDWLATQPAWSVPVPSPTKRPRRLREVSVTAFRAYLECAYRYYLGRELRLEEVPTEQSELSGSGFGSLVHRVMADFGRSDVRESDDAAAIEAFLVASLDDRSRQVFGSQPLPAVRVQLQQARERLRRLAKQQASHRRDGWEIVFAEDEDDRGDRMSCDFPTSNGESIRLVGRVDRIDRHPEFGLAVLDYKTSDAGTAPRSAHVRSRPPGPTPAERWIDLQLPLYRHLVDARLGEQPTRFGYFNIPKNDQHAGVQWAKFSDDELREADELAAAIAADIANEEFTFDPQNRVSFDAFAAICQSGVLDVGAN